MKQFPKYILMLTILMVIFICMPGIVQAQPDPCQDPMEYCPIDGGLSALLAIGAGYGIKKIRDAREGKREKVIG